MSSSRQPRANNRPSQQVEPTEQQGHRRTTSNLNPEAPEFVYNQFGTLPDGGDVTDPNAWPTVDELVDKLLDPPRQSHEIHHGRKGTIIIRMTWVVKTIGEPHFENNRFISRSVLKQNSKVRTHGLAAGLPESYHRWLCGPPGQPTSNEWEIDRTEFWTTTEMFRRVPPQFRIQH